MNEEEYEELARWLPCHPGRWVAWPEPFGTRAEADALFESLRDGGLESLKKAHYGLLKKGWIAEDYDEDSREWTTRPGAERLAAALTRYGEYRILPCFGWMILIVRDHKNEKHDEKRN